MLRHAKEKREMKFQEFNLLQKIKLVQLLEEVVSLLTRDGAEMILRDFQGRV